MFGKQSPVAALTSLSRCLGIIPQPFGMWLCRLPPEMEVAYGRAGATVLELEVCYYLNPPKNLPRTVEEEAWADFCKVKSNCFTGRCSGLLERNCSLLTRYKSPLVGAPVGQWAGLPRTAARSMNELTPGGGRSGMVSEAATCLPGLAFPEDWNKNACLPRESPAKRFRLKGAVWQPGWRCAP